MKAPDENIAQPSLPLRCIGKFGEIPLVRSEADEPILSIEEVRMDFGNPVIESGVNYGDLSRLYRQAVHDEVCDDKFREWNERPLSDFKSAANRHEMAYLHKLLTERDRAKKRGATFGEFHAYLKEEHGYSETDRTLRRQLAHARMAMVLAAKGLIDRLPSQNVSAIISSKFGRQAWIPFLRRHPVKHGSPSKIKKLICDFSSRTGTPLRLQEARPVTLPSLKSVMAASTLPEKSDDVGTTGASGKPTATCLKPKKVQIKHVAKLLAPQLDGIVPAYHLEDPTALAKAIIESLDQSTHAVPRPARHQKLDELAAKLTVLDPVRAQELAKAAMRLMLGAALDKATKKMGSRKNVTPDTPCPKLIGGEEPADPAA